MFSEQCPHIAGCGEQWTCEGRCGGSWCGPRNFKSPPWSLLEKNLASQPFRPPKQTSYQKQKFSEISISSAPLAAAAEQWALEYMNSSIVRSRLHASLNHLTNDELLERLRWEFPRLPIFHNGPTGPANAVEVRNILNHDTQDDTTLGANLRNGYIQNTCQRHAFGSTSQAVYPPNTFIWVEAIGMNASKILPEGPRRRFPEMYTGHWSTTKANSCLLYNANNIGKFGAGNTLYYGGVTYALNPATMGDRVFVEPYDAGMLDLFKNMNWYPVEYPLPLGTTKDWLHLLQMHQSATDMDAHLHTRDGTADCSIADAFNRWYVPDHPVGPLKDVNGGFPYFELMSIGNTWLPEDLLYSIVPFDSKPQERHSIGLWGTAMGAQLRAWSKKVGRPLIWVSAAVALHQRDSAMLLDPWVGGVAGEWITPADVALFEVFWGSANSTNLPDEVMFESLASLAAPRLHFEYQGWDKRTICAEAENDSAKMVMGYNGDGRCVYWVMPPQPTRWELLNDGSCTKSTDPERAVYSSFGHCAAAVFFFGFICVEPATPHRRFCAPGVGNGTGYGPEVTVGATRYKSMADCEAACAVEENDFTIFGREFTESPSQRPTRSPIGTPTASPSVTPTGSPTGAPFVAVDWPSTVLSDVSTSFERPDHHVYLAFIVVLLLFCFVVGGCLVQRKRAMVKRRPLLLAAENQEAYRINRSAPEIHPRTSESTMMEYLLRTNTGSTRTYEISSTAVHDQSSTMEYLLPTRSLFSRDTEDIRTDETSLMKEDKQANGANSTTSDDSKKNSDSVLMGEFLPAHTKELQGYGATYPTQYIEIGQLNGA